jgi:hypothetical protein
MCRTWLSHPNGPPARRGFSQRLVDEFAHLENGREGRKNAYDVLVKKENRKLTIYPDPGRQSDIEPETEQWRFEDLVLRMWHIMEQMKDHQVKIQNSTLHQLENPLRATLEGFGFLDIVFGDMPLRPRHRKMDYLGGRWLKVTDGAGTINIIGSGLGDLMQSAESSCKLGGSVPKGADLLAAPVSILGSIAEKNGAVHVDHIELVEGVFWNQPHALLDRRTCACSKSAFPGHKCEVPVLELDRTARPKSSSKSKLKSRDKVSSTVFEQYPTAAVIIASTGTMRNALHSSVSRNEQAVSNSPAHSRQAWDSGLEIDKSLSLIQSNSSQEGASMLPTQTEVMHQRLTTTEGLVAPPRSHGYFSRLLTK